ncbi:MAG: 16S rRNA (guanine(966)-N(2))-methyltransferase RsmD [Candidatus Cloacimonetes bacterium HGW-Cloacimonetes-3]|jgi:16S rRNA (guanine966-N2)-methyltransferase|nr:MAG: 16S rRNA (guanine(966)-N(2))-methyltransferase RsmD [Candidatus Cloacimonetes bacterium HGW-Cloacimonetes-3]
MRIITGAHKGRNLHLVPGKSTRPTTSFNREMIFSVHQDYDAKRVLDLYAGTGSFGLEAISRGASWVDFVEFAPAAMGTILKNISLLGCGDSCHLWRKKVDAYLKGCTDTYDIIFMDPPYQKNLVNPTLKLIIDRGLLNSGGLIVVEHSPKEAVAEDLPLVLVKQKGSKSSSFSWLTI